MEKLDWLVQLHRIFKARRYPVSTRQLSEELECTEKTVRRYIDILRYEVNAPIVNERRKGWKYDDPNDLFELPGIWLTSRDLIGLASILSLTDAMDSDLIDKELLAIRAQIYRLLERKGIPTDTFDKKIKVLTTNKQLFETDILNHLSEALLNSQQISIRYQSYSSAITQRIVSPQKLVYYQENWYLDSYCHLRKALRSFKVSRVLQAQVMRKKARVVAKRELENYFAGSYGIFSGKAKHTVKLRFFGDAAREVAQQQWHSQQVGEWDGHDYVLSFGYSDDRELVRDIFKYANNVEVIAPAKLRQKILNIAKYTVERYTGRRLRV